MSHRTPHSVSSQKETRQSSLSSLEVGRIVLGGRTFLVLPIKNGMDYREYSEYVQFKLDKVLLGVFKSPRRDQEAFPDPGGDPLSQLSERELQIAVLVAQGHATKNIAYRLQISEWTVATYIRRLYAKLNVDNRAAMVFRCTPMIQAALVHGLTCD